MTCGVDWDVLRIQENCSDPPAEELEEQLRSLDSSTMGTLLLPLLLFLLVVTPLSLAAPTVTSSTFAPRDYFFAQFERNDAFEPIVTRSDISAVVFDTKFSEDMYLKSKCPTPATFTRPPFSASPLSAPVHIL